MAVMERKSVNDKRLDDLNLRVESIDRRMETGFAEVREEFRAVRNEMKSESQAARQEMATGFASVRGEMAVQVAALNHTMHRLFGGVIVAWVVGVIAIIVQT